MSQKSSVMQLPQFVPKALTSDSEPDRIGRSGFEVAVEQIGVVFRFSSLDPRGFPSDYFVVGFPGVPDQCGQPGAGSESFHPENHFLMW